MVRIRDYKSMSEEIVLTPQTIAPPGGLFPEPVVLRPCSTCECTRGHQWEPVMALAKCGYNTPTHWVGCQAPILAIKEGQCPVCNEPMAKISIRVDVTPPAPWPVPMCVPGSKSMAEVGVIELERKLWKATEEKSSEDSGTIDGEVKEFAV